MLEAANITKRYKKKTVLSAVGFALRPGECLGIAGHNGSGKSTLLSIVAQTLRPDAGTLRCDGHDILGDRRFLRSMLGYVPQQDALLEDLTVLETLRFWQKTYGVGGDLFAPSGACAMLGLEAMAKKRVGALSGGMKKRLSCALALLHAPQYLLLDEVLPALDRHYRSQLFSWLAAYKKGGASILYCSHEAAELMDFCDSILVLREGRVVFYDAAAAFPAEAGVLDEWMNPLAAQDY